MRSRLEPLLYALVCLVMIDGYFWLGRPAVPELGHGEPRQQHYNQLVAGFRSGHLWLAAQPSPALARMADPYDPVQNQGYQFHDGSYYRGRFYIYYGVTPALLLFWPYVALTGQYLAQKTAVSLFCSLGFAVGAFLVWDLRRRYFPRAGTATLLALGVAMGAVNGAAFLARRPEVYEVSISCAYAMMMAGLAAVWAALHLPRRALTWTMAASLCFGLAVAARPSFLFGAAAVLIPLASLLQAGPGASLGRQIGRAATALAPLAAIGLGLAIYNYQRFGNPLEFGIKYLMMGKEVNQFFRFDRGCMALNIRLYLLQPARLGGYFPFVREAAVPALPPGYGFVEDPYGVLTNLPFLLLGLAAPLAWRGRGAAEAVPLRRFAGAVGWVALTSVVLLLGYVVASFRYEVDFTPYLTLLAVLGVFGIETAGAGRRYRFGARAGWLTLLALSVAFNFFGSCRHFDKLRQDDPGGFQALSMVFNAPRYAWSHWVAGGSPGTAPAPVYGPVVLEMTLPDQVTGTREPLAEAGGSGGHPFRAFVQRSAPGQVYAGFEIPDQALYTYGPFRAPAASPLTVTLYAPTFLPDLGDPAWGAVSYPRQIRNLGLYMITVNGVPAAQVAPLDRPIGRDGLRVGVNPQGDPYLGSTFTGRVTRVSRLPLGESRLEH